MGQYRLTTTWRFEAPRKDVYEALRDGDVS
jgi:hypothetical protein